MTAPRSPGVKFPPPTLFVAGFLLGWLFERWVVRLRLVGEDASAAPLVWAGSVAMLLGLAMSAWGLITFFRARTAIMPHHAASRLVTHGPYRFTRNPMYVGMSLLHIGLALRMNMGWPLLMLPLSLAALYLLVIRREERYLGAEFGDEYAAYRRRVRRWI